MQQPSDINKESPNETIHPTMDTPMEKQYPKQYPKANKKHDICRSKMKQHGCKEQIQSETRTKKAQSGNSGARR
jgi:hypothetical protein